MNYNTSQNLTSSYSNNQNPPSSYLNNQNPSPPPARVAQANPAAKKSIKDFRNMSDREILKFVWPGKMGSVQLKPYSENLNPLVNTFSYGAWTQNKNLIYYRDDLDDFGPPWSYMLPYILRHEGQHIIQFQKYGQPKSFVKMLEFEVEAYSKTHEWVSKEGKAIWTDAEEFKNVEKEAKGYSEETSEVMDLFKTGKISAYFSKKNFAPLPKVAKFYKEDVEEFIKNRNVDGPSIKGELLAQILQIRYDGLPMFKKAENKYMRYSVKDMYRVGKSKKDKDRFVELGYTIDE